MAEENLEMAMNLRQTETGLPFVIWVSTKEAYGKDINHGPRVKVMNSHDRKAKRELMYAIDVRPPHLVRRPTGTVIDSSDVTIMRKWLKKNMEPLLLYWEDEISVPEFLEMISPGIKVP